MTRKLIVCDCLGSQKIDGEKLSQNSGASCLPVLTDACGTQIDQTAKTLSENADVMIACQQQARLFTELAEEISVDVPAFVDIRDRAGWTAPGEDPSPKMAALIAEAMLPRPSEKSIDVESSGTCLVIGGSEAAINAARDLSTTLAVTLLLPTAGDFVVGSGFDTVAGKISHASGSLGQFELRIDGFQQPVAGGRGASTWSPVRDGAQSACDVIVDLSGAAPLFAAPEKRDGYLRADPGSTPAVATTMLSASQLVGTFEKPLYVRLEESLCAHSRAEKTACSKCLNTCPTGAITSAGEHVAIDPLICAGCGACSALCPSGAISYDSPPVETVFSRLHTLASTYRKAGGDAPRLLVHDAEFGNEIISLSARHGRGLPANVIPLEVAALAGFGHAEMLAGLACGFTDINILCAPKTERDVLESEAQLASAICGHETIHILDVSDPDVLSDTLYDAKTSRRLADPVLPMGTRRQVTRLAAKALLPDAEVLPLPEEAPYGAILVDADACTLCLSCVSLCPSGALGDNPDNPQLRFQEDACLQCGLCGNICPENAITLKPQLNLTDAAFTQNVLHEEEPFACIECGALFGVKSTVERITEKLAGKHSMFSNPDAARLIQMCDDCRVQAQFHSTDNPFAGKERPRVRTTEDYLSKRRDH